MLVSMTGFGRAEVTQSNWVVFVEIKSVNARFAEFSFKLPPVISDCENQLRAFLQQKIERGKFTVYVKIENLGGPVLALPELSTEKIAAVRSYLNQICEAAGLESKPSLADIMAFVGEFGVAAEESRTSEELLPLVFRALDEAISALSEQRRREGENLARDLSFRLASMEKDMTTIRALAKDRVPEARARLTERIRQWVSDDSFDANRLEMEIALLADKLDITEELVRLESHFGFFRQAIDAKEATGRKLNFLVQEMHREINTIGSKANNAQISQLTVQMKENLEIVREQIQNIE